MGTEIVPPICAFLTVAILAWLVVRSIQRRSRPFALPTLVATVIFVLVTTNDDQYHHYWSFFVMNYVGGAILLGLQAHAIRWLLSRSARDGAS
jgi:hypothetical protein